ncbi:MAG: sigma-70 family RNA polymerase sigma factor [Planctomycetota bacterium]
MKTATDDALMGRLRRGSPPARDAAFRELVRRHARGLRAYVAPIAGPAQADDVIQETFLRVYQHRQRYEAGPASFRTWAYRIARNLALNRRRKEQRVRPLEDVGSGRLVAAGKGPEAKLTAQLEGDALRAAIEGLGRSDREVVTLRFQRGLSYSEIAEVTGASPAAVKQRTWRALKRLRDTLETPE